MGINVGIVGLPNVGKSTLFSLITKTSVEIANYPFATINPSVGIIEVNDPNIPFLKEVYKPKKTILNWIKFIDIAGLVKGASKGKGLGNKFLSNIREANVICEVIRCFKSKHVLHIENRINPLDDLNIISTELMLADIETISNALSKNQKRIKASNDKALLKKLETWKKAINMLNDSDYLKEFQAQFDKEEWSYLEELNLLTIKPKFFVINVNELEWKEVEKSPEYIQLSNFIQEKKYSFIKVALNFEYELTKINSIEEKNMFLAECNIEGPQFHKISQLGFNLLSLQTFYTCGENEVHAWSFKKGMKAKECAGKIHSDIQKGFIKAEIYNIADLKRYKSPKMLKEKGLIRIEGKNYIMQNGDICYFHFSK